MPTRINCCERCSAVSRFGDGKTRINWCSAPRLQTMTLRNPHCNPSRDGIPPPDQPTSVECATVLTSGKVRCSPSSPCSRQGRLRVAPGGSAPPIPCVARRGRGGVRSGQESRLADQTEKLIRRYRGAEASGIPLRPDDDRNLRLSSTNYRHPQLRIHTERRLTKHRRAGSILMRQCPARSGAFLDEATRPAITRVALQTELRLVYKLVSPQYH